MRASYTVDFERDDSGWWVAQVKEAPGAITQGRTIEEARRRVREALAALLDDPRAERVILVDRVKLPQPVRRVVEQSRQAFEARARADVQVRKRVRIAIKALNRQLGLSLKDTADLLGVSRQRVHQILNSPSPRD